MIYRVPGAEPAALIYIDSFHLRDKPVRVDFTWMILKTRKLRLREVK